MAGIISFGAYVPHYRLDWSALNQAWAKGTGTGRRSVANYDEDSITMAVAAGLNCLSGIQRNGVDSLYFASTTEPYHEKQSAALVGSAMDLRPDILSVDFGNSLRSGTSALLAALDAAGANRGRKVLVTASDCRMAIPASEQERAFGDGAAALLVGDSNVVADVEASYSVSDEILDLWRNETDQFVKTWEDRFVISEGYSKNVREAVSGLLARSGLTMGDFAAVVFNAPDARTHRQTAGLLDLDAKRQPCQTLVGSVGNTGAAYALMLLVATLESAKPGDRILVVNYGDGCDAVSLRATENIAAMADRRARGLSRFMDNWMRLASYEKYLAFRGVMAVEPPRRPTLPTSPARLWREREEIYRFHAFRCKRCGEVMFPKPAKIRVCLNCQAIDEMEHVPAADLRGKVFSFVVDHLYGSLDPPTVTALIDFEGGGRLYCSMADRDVDRVKVGSDVRMVFRKIVDIAGIHNYYWKFKLV